MKKRQPLIIQYANLLHAYGNPDTKPVREFLKKHEKNQVFVRRAKKLNTLFMIGARLKKNR